MGKVLLSIWRFIVETFIKKMARRISFFMAINPQFRLKEFGYEKSETALRFRFYFLLCALPCERLLCSQRSLRPCLSCN